MTNEADRADGAYENVFAGAGGRADRSSFTRAASARFLSAGELDRLYESDGFARKIVDLPAEEAVRAGYCIEGVDAPETIYASLEAINALEKICDAMRWSDLYGGSLIVMIADDGQTLDQPLAAERVRSLEALRVYDRWQVSRAKKYMDPADSRFGGTQLYMISPDEGTPYAVHESRCIVLDGAPLPSRLRSARDGWGGSKIQHCYDQLARFGMAHQWANGLLERAQQAVHGIPDLTGLLRVPGGEELVRRRVDLVDMTRSINNTIVIDGAESYDLKSTSLSGVSDIVDRFGLALSAVAGIPEALLFGRTQSGLNSSGAAELESWYAKVGQMQQNVLLPALDRLITVQLHALGMYTDDYLVKFNPLYVPSAKEAAEVDHKRAQTYEVLHGIGALDASEIRAMLPGDGYMIDNVELIPEADDDSDEAV